MIRHVIKRAAGFILKGKIRMLLKSIYHDFLRLLNADAIVYTSDPQVFFRKLKKMQKHTLYAKYWSKMEKFNSSEYWPDHYKVIMVQSKTSSTAE